MDLNADHNCPAFIVFSTADWNAPYWTNKQHVADRLARRGHNVLYIESPGIRRPGANARDLSRMFGRVRQWLRSPREERERLWVYSPLTIPFGHRNKCVKAFNDWLTRRSINTWLSRKSINRFIIWTYHPYMVDAVRHLERQSLVYHCVDDLASIPGVDKLTFRQAEVHLLETADVIFTTSPVLQKRCESIAGRRSIYERNVADIEHFSRARTQGVVPADLASIKGPKLGYVGVLSEYKIDFSLVEHCATVRTDWQWIFIGDEPERQTSAAIRRLKKLANVHFFGYRPYNDLPGYLRGIDVAVLPNLTTGYMAGVFPMKLYEYLAAGKPVISTPLQSLHEIGDLVHIAGDRDAWIDRIDRILANGSPQISTDDPRLSEYTWEKRLDRMLNSLAAHSVSKQEGGCRPTN